MKKNKEISKESSEKDSTWLCHSEYYKKSKLCIRNGGMCVQDWNKLKKYIPKCSPKDLLLNLCNFRLNDMYNMGGIKFTKLIVIYELLILQFSVVMGYDSNFNNTGIEKYLCEFCKKFSIFPQCNQLAVSIPVTLLFFLFVITMFSLICCNCRCGKKNKDKYVEYGRFIMGPDGKMYDRLMMNPQMFQDGKIPEEMCQEGMQEQGMRGPEVQEPEMQQTESKEPGMQQTERNDPRIKQSKLQEPDMNENENKHKNKKRSTDYNNPNDDELHVGYKPL